MAIVCYNVSRFAETQTSVYSSAASLSQPRGSSCLIIISEMAVLAPETSRAQFDPTENKPQPVDFSYYQFDPASAIGIPVSGTNRSPLPPPEPLAPRRSIRNQLACHSCRSAATASRHVE